MALETAFIQEKLAQQFGNNVLNFEMKRERIVIAVDRVNAKEMNFVK
mgnify:CR=1 FL=1